jgi:hypothetical protein
MVGVAAAGAVAGAGCTKLTAPDGIQIEGGIRKLTALTPCSLTMPEGYATERGSVPDLQSCTSDSRIKP